MVAEGVVVADLGFDVLTPKDKTSVCVNSIVHLLLRGSFDVLAFDLRTYKFSIISTPQGVMPIAPTKEFTMNNITFLKGNMPYIIKINGCVGLVCHDHVVESTEIQIQILQDYENRVCVKEIITFPESWIELDDPLPLPLDGVNMDEATKWSPELAVACEAWKEIKFEFQAMVTLDTDKDKDKKR
ncbi:hypothetical protein QVD17_39797 [Tagetes erecta]|uniref:Uncharacterized protein n=1 Tax=Tagetes erecta TaxID=13708 RepID=A0AAD8JT11_TARER|nr:hypothetical protein QVD17_39797 [Tagetes erecta]